MKLIADSGSTKILWTFIDDGNVIRQLESGGLNPYHQSEEEILEQLSSLFVNERELVRSVYFYGAGVTSGSRSKIERCFERVFTALDWVSLENDILAAAHALCQSQAGIACILGTGSNSCLYDGHKVTNNIGGFGFILGDEGSGAALGKQLLQDFLYRKLPEELEDELFLEYELNADIILETVYRKPFPNRWLASFALFLAKHRQDAYVQPLLEKSFHNFFLKKVICYNDYEHYPIHFTGSIAFHFQEELRHVGEAFGIGIGTISKTPIQGLIEYHLQKI